MEYTKNYHLPQWKEDDRIMMGDFNAAMSNIDSGLEGVKTTAHAEAAAAQAAADAAYSPSNKPYVAGNYRGNGNTQTITLGFCPSLVVIAGDESFSTPSGHYGSLGSHFGVVTADHNYGSVTLNATGFTVTNNNTCPELNKGSKIFAYIAFR